MVMDSEVHVSLHIHFYHEIVFEKFYLKFFYAAPYERTVWYFFQVNSVDLFDWGSELTDLDVIKQVSILNDFRYQNVFILKYCS